VIDEIAREHGMIDDRRLALEIGHRKNVMNGMAFDH
jgi:hypothetical protein